MRLDGVPLDEAAIDLQARVAIHESTPLGQWRMMLLTARGPVTLKEAARTLRQSYVDGGQEVRLEVVLDMGGRRWAARPLSHMRREMES